jgi:hypothetical protein
MSDTATLTSAEPATTTSSTRGASRILLAIVVVQAVWLGVLSTRGWFYDDDFNFLAQAVHPALSWGYLTSPINDHLTPGLRLMFWLIAHFGHLHYTATVVVRQVLQAASTVLLYRLLLMLTGSPRGSLVITAVYAVNPLLVPTTLYLASAVNQQPAQVFALLAFIGCVRHARGGRLWWAALAGISLLGAACFWEKTAADTSVCLVILRFGWLTTGSLRIRLMTNARAWLGWLLMLGPLAGFVVAFVLGGYGSSAHDLSIGSALHLSWSQWSRALWPTVLGGPWRWFSVPDVYTAAADPRGYAIVLGQVAFVGLAALGWWRNRWRGLFAWTLPVAAVLVGQTLVAIGRFSLLGNITPLDFHYVFDLAIPLAIACGLACCGRSRPRRSSERSLERRWVRRRLAPVATAAALVGLTASSVFSTVVWTRRFDASPTHGYVSNILAGIRGQSLPVNLYDTGLSIHVLPYLEQNRHLSDLLGSAGVSVAFDRTSPDPQVVDDTGHIRPSAFFPVATANHHTNSFCAMPLQGIATRTLHLRPAVGANEYFLRLDYFEQRPAELTTTVRDASGKIIPVRGSSTLVAGEGPGSSLFALSTGSPTTVSVASDSAATNICFTNVTIGIPLVAGR